MLAITTASRTSLPVNTNFFLEFWIRNLTNAGVHGVIAQIGQKLEPELVHFGQGSMMHVFSLKLRAHMQTSPVPKSFQAKFPILDYLANK